MENKTKAELLQLIAERDEIVKKLEADAASLVEELAKLEEKICDDVVEKLTAEKKELLELLKISCDNNCPHHHAPEACKNCSIEQRLSKISQ